MGLKETFKGAFKNYSGWAQLLILVGMFLLGTIIFSFIATIIIFIQIIATSGLSADILDLIYSDPTYMRELQFIAGIGQFLVPTLACAYFFSDDYKAYLSLDTHSSYKVYILTFFVAIVFLPISNFTGMLNQQMALPEWLSGLEEWMRASEAAAAEATEMLLTGKSIWTLLANLLLIAVLAGVGEEFFFRGVGQNIVGKLFKNHHVVIWVVAIIFSAIHMQFYGFLPRMLLGAYFGYLLYYTKNMWLPVLAHFTNNAFIVIFYYFYQDSTEELEQMDAIGWGDTWWVAVAAAALFVFLFSLIVKQTTTSPNPSQGGE